MNSKGIDCLGDNGVCIPISTHSVKTVKKQTRADVIRSMNDEELAKFINGFSTICELCNLHAGCCNVETTKCKNGILEWLQSETE